MDINDHTMVPQTWFLNPVCETVVWSLMFRVENVFEKKNEKNPVCKTVVWSLADRVKNLIEKKLPCHSDSDMVTGGLNFSLLITTHQNNATYRFHQSLQTCKKKQLVSHLILKFIKK